MKWGDLIGCRARALSDAKARFILRQVPEAAQKETRGPTRTLSGLLDCLQTSCLRLPTAGQEDREVLILSHLQGGPFM